MGTSHLISSWIVRIHKLNILFLFRRAEFSTRVNLHRSTRGNIRLFEGAKSSSQGPKAREYSHRRKILVGLGRLWDRHVCERYEELGHISQLLWHFLHKHQRQPSQNDVPPEAIFLYRYIEHRQENGRRRSRRIKSRLFNISNWKWQVGESFTNQAAQGSPGGVDPQEWQVLPHQPRWHPWVRLSRSHCWIGTDLRLRLMGSWCHYL